MVVAGVPVYRQRGLWTEGVEVTPEQLQVLADVNRKRDTMTAPEMTVALHGAGIRLVAKQFSTGRAKAWLTMPGKGGYYDLMDSGGADHVARELVATVAMLRGV